MTTRKDLLNVWRATRSMSTALRITQLSRATTRRKEGISSLISILTSTLHKGTTRIIISPASPDLMKASRSCSRTGSCLTSRILAAMLIRRFVYSL